MEASSRPFFPCSSTSFPYAALVGVLLLLAGVDSAAFHPQAVVAAGTLSGERRAFEISVFTSGGSVGFAVGPLAIIGAVHLWASERSYYTMIPGLLSVLLLGLYLKTPGAAGHRGRVLALAPAFKGAQQSMALFFSIAVIREFARIAVVTFLPIFLAVQGRSLAAGGITLPLFSMAGALGGMIGGSLSDAWGRKTVILASGLLCVPLLHGMFRMDGLISLLLLMLAAGTLSGANSVIIASAQELVPLRAGTASSLVMGLGWGVAGGLRLALARWRRRLACREPWTSPPPCRCWHPDSRWRCRDRRLRRRRSRLSRLARWPQPK